VKRKKEFYEYPKRVCYSMHHCEICGDKIHALQDYYDGGWDRRCHVACAPPEKPLEKPPETKGREG